MTPPLPVWILHHAPDARGAGPWRESDAGVMAEVEAVGAALRKLGVPFQIVPVRTLAEAARRLASRGACVVFNLVESLAGDPADFAWIPDLCRALEIGCTGCDGLCQALCLDKWRAKALLASAGLPTPPAIRVTQPEEVTRTALPPAPWIVKPMAAEGSEGIHDDAVVQPGEINALQRAVRRLQDTLRQDALVETFVNGREINAALMEREGRVEVLPLAEIEFRDYGPDRPRLVSYAAKWLSDSFEYRNTVRGVPADLDEDMADGIRRLALKAWQVLGCRDYARVDIRLDQQGRPWILEVNANPDLAPEAGFAAALAAGGILYEEFVQCMIANAAARARRQAEEGASVAARRLPEPLPCRVRSATRDDRDEILRFVTEAGFFRPDEVAVAREVLDDSLLRPRESGYCSLVAEREGLSVGWICFGPTPCTLGTFDIYWIVVAADHRRSGIGSALLAEAERLIAEAGGRLCLIETSGRPLYRPTRRFYEGAGYREMARLPDFYAPGDDKIVYSKMLLVQPRNA